MSLDVLNKDQLNTSSMVEMFDPILGLPVNYSQTEISNLRDLGISDL